MANSLGLFSEKSRGLSYWEIEGGWFGVYGGGFGGDEGVVRLDVLVIWCFGILVFWLDRLLNKEGAI